MNLISFDVGIKNMSYCIFEITENDFLIKDWNVLNLMDEVSEIPKCNCIINKKKPNKKTSKSVIIIEDPKECGKLAKYIKNDKYYCEKHSKSQTSYLQYNKECSPIKLKKKKLEELKTLCNQYSITHDENNASIQYTNKTSILNVLQHFYNNRILEPIKEIKTKNAGETGLISIGRNMRTLLNKIHGISEVTHAIIENQISPIANRMKTIQGMLAQYFIMKESECSPSIHIEFVSSFNKLKNFAHLRNTDVENIDESSSSYKSNKKDGIIVCSHFLNNNTQLSMWIDKLNCKKKDDLADCFLQGIWYLNSKHKIQYNEECKVDISQCSPT
jgi:hypothetical protein